ncbi:MAG: hypothetical protein IKU00_02080 [Bacteroidales bacterium]|nr:hypothetical protein [Bacteroidales bacterium]
MKKAFLILVFVLSIVLPAKAQLYAGGGFAYYKNKVSYPDSEVKHFSISPEIGFRYHNLSAGLTFSYISKTYSNHSYSDLKQYIVEPYIRYDIITREKFGFFADAFYTYVNSTDIFGYITHEVGISPGVFYKLTDRFSTLFRFGIVGYSSNESNGFKGFGINLSMSTSRIGFYYSFW